MAVGALWVDDAFYFSSGPGTRKSRNLAADPHCVLTVATHAFDVVVEGTAERVTDTATLQRIADLFAGQGWEAGVDEAALALRAPYNAPSAGPPPWYVYKMTPETAYAVGTTEPFGATRWTF
jgi:hypothetical protein